MVNHNYGTKGKVNRDDINKQRKEMGVDKFEGLLPDWQSKTSYYNHIPKLNVDGKLWKPCGSEYPNMPSDSDTQKSKGNIGLFPIQWDGKCRLEAKGEECKCNPKQEKVKEEVKVEAKKTSI